MKLGYIASNPDIHICAYFTNDTNEIYKVIFQDMSKGTEILKRKLYHDKKSEFKRYFIYNRHKVYILA